MGIKDVFSQTPSPEEEVLYKQVLDEMESGIQRKGIYAKALADSLGDVLKANSLYIRYRVESLRNSEKYEAKLINYENKQAAKKAKIEAKEKKERDRIKAIKIRNKKIASFFTSALLVICVVVLISLLIGIMASLFSQWQ